MSNEAKGPYRTGYERGYHTVIDGSGVVVYSDDTSAGVNMFADAANYAHHHALTLQAARVRELEEALRLCERTLLDTTRVMGRSELRDWVSSTIMQVRVALTPKEPQQ